jgi:hypothetical protein
MERDPQLSALYRATADAGPPPALDDAIRAVARREVSAGPRRGGMRRWQLPLSLAAVLVLSVSLVTLMREEGADRPQVLLQPLPPAERQKPAAEAPVPQPARSAERLPVPAAPAPRAEVRQPSAASPESRAAAPPAADAAAAMAEDAAGPRLEPAPRPLLRSAPAPLADRPAGPPARSMALSVPPASDALWRDLAEAPAEQWLQRIAELRAAGRGADADALTAEFRRRFPDVILPAEAR